MKRFHVHLSVPDLAESIHFYSGLFGFEPTVRKDDYAKWVLDEPRVNFAISYRGNGRTGLNHLGLQAESADELASIRGQFERADASATVAEPNAHCCYVRSDKHWVTDPQGIAWEAFHTLDTIPLYDSNAASEQATGCCTPAATKAQCCAPAADAANAHREKATACC